MNESLDPISFLDSYGTIFDVRSPAEYAKGHIPEAVNIPLFDSQERSLIGTLYKQVGKEEAILEGLRLVGPKMAHFVEMACQASPEKAARVYCWRGGMRSSSMGWLLKTYGFQVQILEGGYKTFRKWVLNSFSIKRTLHVLGGLTGSGKTVFLEELRRKGTAVLDLEKLASHRGSAFGNIGMPPQPSSEQFENLIAIELKKIPAEKPLWVEDESRTIGTCHIPHAFYEQMRQAPLHLIKKTLEERIHHLIKEYGEVPPEVFSKAVSKLEKRLGKQKTKEILHSDRKSAIHLLLEYYDKAYLYNLTKQQRVIAPLNFI